MGLKTLSRLGLTAVLFICASVSEAATLSGLAELSTDASGNFYNGSIWSTHNDPHWIVKAWVIQSANLQGPFVNGPSASQANISIPLSEGEHTFVFFANQGGFTPHHGLNLFFNGDNVTPRISVFGATQTSSHSVPPFSANGGNTVTITAAPVPGANTLVFQDATARIELIDYRFANISVHNLDRVSQLSTSPDGGADFIGQFTLRVTDSTPPPPTSFDLSRDFSITANPNGPWSYGWLTTLDGSFGLLPFLNRFSADNGVPLAAWLLRATELPSVVKNIGSTTAVSDGGSFVGPPGIVWITPGFDGAPQNFGVARFTVPAGGDGDYRIETAVQSLFDGTRSADADFHVLKDGEELFGQFLPRNSATGYSNTVHLSAGSTIDFAVGRGTDGLLAHSGLKIRATLTRVDAPPPPPPPLITLSGLAEFSTDTNGNFFNGSIWSTHNDPYWIVKAWVIHSANLQGPFINGPSGSQANISIPLSDGEHTFVFFANQGGFTPHHGLNLFFNGDNVTPRISVFGATQTSSNSVPPFSANGGNTVTIAATPVPGANTLVFQDTTARVELIDYRFANISVHNLDRVSQLSTSPDGGADFIGQFTLRVTKVPVVPTAPVLTGLLEFSTDANGSFFNGSVWNTRGGDTAVNLWVAKGTDLHAPFVNGPDDAQAGINIQLQPGINEFVIYGNQGGPTPHHGLNLFFNGDNASPGISVFGATQTSPDQPFPAFAANSSSSTLTLDFQPVPGAGTLLYQQGEVRVELTHYRWADPFVYDIDRVSQPVATPDGGFDFIGRFTLNVTGLGEPPPSAHIALSPQFRIEGAPHALVVACDGESANIVLDARGSTDPDGDALAYAWFSGDSQQPFSTESVVHTTAHLGLHSVTLVVSDGQASANATLVFEVITPAEAAAQLRSLLEAAKLSRKQAHPLQAALRAAINSLEEGRIRAAIGQLGAFAHKVRVQLGSSHPALAESLTAGARSLIEILENCGRPPRDRDDDHGNGNDGRERTR